MPRVIKLGKYKFFFFSREAGEPIHIHVSFGDDYAKFWLEPIELAKSIGYSAREINELKRLILENTDVLKEKWHEHFKA